MSNIFTGIHGNLQLMEMVLNGNPEVKANMASIKECVERAALFIKQLAKENDVNCVSLPQFIASSAEEILRNKGICYTLSVAPHINEKYISQECFSYIIRSVLFYLKDVVLENEELVISVDTCKADPKIHLRLDCDYICIRFIFLEKDAGFCADVQNSNRSWAMERMSNLAKSYSLLRKVGGVLNYDTEPDEVVLYLPFS